MKRGKRKVDHIIIGAAVILVGAAWVFSGISLDTSMKDWRDGDLVVQQSSFVPILPVFGDAENAPAHIGIVKVGPQGPVVIQVLDTVVETPLKEFLANGNTTDFAVYRVNGLDASRASTVLATARAFLGRPGDFFLDDTQDRLYSSELVRLAFARAGVSLGRTDRLRTLARGNKGVEAAFGAKWGQSRPCTRRYLDQAQCWNTVGNHEVIPPQWIIADPQVTQVYATSGAAPMLLTGRTQAPRETIQAESVQQAPADAPPALRP